MLRSFILFISLLFFLSSPAAAQKTPQQKIDSIAVILRSAPKDTARIRLLTAAAVLARDIDLEKATTFASEGFALSKELESEAGIAEFTHILGMLDYDRGDFSKAKNRYKDALEIYTRLQNQKGIAQVLYHLGAANYFTGEHGTAISNIEKALNIYVSLKDQGAVSDCYIAMGNIYGEQGNRNKELEYNKKALAVKLEQKDNYGIAACYTNIGNVYGAMGQNDTALKYYSKGLEIAKQLDDQTWTRNIIGNTGIIYVQQKRFKEGMACLEQCLEMAQQSGDKHAIASSYNSIGETYRQMGDLPKSLEYIEKSLAISKETGSKNEIRASYDNLAAIYAEMGDYKKAYEFHQLFSAMKDTLFNEESSRQITEMGAKYEATQKDNEIALLNKDNEIKTANNRQQQIIIWAIGAGLFLVLLLTFFIFRQFREKQKANVALQTAYAEIEEKNKDITDSINYAKRIQAAILPSMDVIRNHLPGSFIVYQPKDIVSGDFYWFAEKNGMLIFAVADCTGHGVPGAFMSMIGNDLLTQIVIEKGITSPAGILTKLHEGVMNALRQNTGSSETRDGMDIAVVAFDKNRPGSLSYAGALRPLWLIRKGSAELKEYKADKHSIGGTYSEEPRIFSEHSLQLEAGDTFYLSTDGYADQFGGEQGKKMMTKNMKELLLSIRESSMNEQKQELIAHFNAWKKNREQVDDVLVAGFRI
jgi:serine phosphatase RsbU (regulator of sigma subunit)/Tfp pilus assembly protein PilF